MSCRDTLKRCHDRREAWVFKPRHTPDIRIRRDGCNQVRGDYEVSGFRDVEVPFALRDDRRVEVGERDIEARDVRARVRRDVREVSVEGGVVTGGCEVGLGVVCETLTVEGILEILHVLNELQQVDVVSAGWSGLVEGGVARFEGCCADACGC